jgi:hypothetical protein
MSSVQNIISGDHPTNECQGTRGDLHESQGGLPRSSPLRSDGSRDSQAGWLDCMSGGQSKSRGGGHQAQVY